MKTHRPNSERAKLYRRLIRLGLPTFQATRMRDWTQSHINLFLSSTGKPIIKRRLTPIHAGVKNDE